MTKSNKYHRLDKRSTISGKQDLPGSSITWSLTKTGSEKCNIKYVIFLMLITESSANCLGLLRRFSRKLNLPDQVFNFITFNHLQ